MGEWFFKPKEPGDTPREPIQGEFFAADAISDPGTALVREGIQNSLDAVRDGQQVLVRIFVSGPEQAVPPKKIAGYVEGLQPHLESPGNGLRSGDTLQVDSTCPYLVFEDFGTTGLEGDPAEPFQSRTGQKNHFYHFFRAEGQTDKEAAQRGSWGVGKHVFFRASQISTVFGVTIRASDARRLLFGKCILKHHWLNGRYYQDGYFGRRKKGQSLVVPVEQEEEVQQFCEAFQLRRGKAPGLSIVVPWLDGEVTERAILEAVLRDYFYPILCGQLKVQVETPKLKTILDSGSLISEVSKPGLEVVQDLKPLLELAEWARNVPQDQMYDLNRPPEDRAWQWSAELVPAEAIEALRNAFQKGAPCAVRVPVTVRKRDGTRAPSHFSVYLKRDMSEQSGRPVFIRDGIIISRVDAPRSRGTRALVIADDPPIASFLRDAENPSHTEWQQVRLKADYKSGVSDLRFVKRSVYELVRILAQAEEEEDRTLLADFFSLPAPPEDEEAVTTRQKKPGSKKKGNGKKIEPPPPASPQGFRIQKVWGGFSVLPGDEEISPPSCLQIRVAYNTRRGSPLNKYNRADFRLTDESIKLTPEGLTIIKLEDNYLVAEIHDSKFKLEVTGFDPRRDLYVSAIPKEDRSGDTAA